MLSRLKLLKVNKKFYLILSVLIIFSCEKKQVFIGKKNEGLILNQLISIENLRELGFSKNQDCNCYFRMKQTLNKENEIVHELSYLYGEKFLDSLSIEYYLYSENRISKKEGIFKIKKIVEIENLIPTNNFSIDTNNFIAYKLKWN